MATVGEAQIEQGGLFTNVKKERWNHLQKIAISTTSEVICGPLSKSRKQRTGAEDLLQQSTNHTVLITPFGLHIVTNAIGLRLQELALILGFTIYPVQGDDRERFIQQARVLVFGRTDRQREQLVSKSQRGGILRR